MTEEQQQQEEAFDSDSLQVQRHRVAVDQLEVWANLNRTIINQTNAIYSQEKATAHLATTMTRLAAAIENLNEVVREVLKH